MLRKILFIITVILIHGCARHEMPPEEANLVPESVLNLVYETYPEATNLSSTVIEKNKVYELTFDLKGAKYSVYANSKDIISSAKSNGEATPDSLVKWVNKSIIKGGTFSDYRKVSHTDGNPLFPTVNYRLNGVDFVLTLAGSVIMAPYTKLIVLPNLHDLPEKVVEFIEKRTKPNPSFVNTLVNLNQRTRDSLKLRDEFSFNNAVMHVDSDGSKTYQVNVIYFGRKAQTMIFNDSGDLIWVSDFNAIRQYIQDFTERKFDTNLTHQEIATFSDILRASSHFSGYSLDVSNNLQNSFRNEYAGITSYTLLLSNNSYDRWTLYYNANEKLIFSAYTAMW
ncbi:hypothetical protein LXM25_21555 [Dyadobacter sp. LJ53]|uniref:hypothetical protein n=1 Tax=Dyadobacter chenwenxiniae TaxID=2906456 RepID=UPI001F28D012|nr:hypothetical protein [Dyadobacter chenwenxiniae]MCF0052673.1 hypothetical protein [Dyadobacter chenwenxiniae]